MLTMEFSLGSKEQWSSSRSCNMWSNVRFYHGLEACICIRLFVHLQYLNSVNLRPPVCPLEVFESLPLLQATPPASHRKGGMPRSKVDWSRASIPLKCMFTIRHLIDEWMPQGLVSFHICNNNGSKLAEIRPRISTRINDHPVATSS